jgi:hypothetical protein
MISEKIMDVEEINTLFEKLHGKPDYFNQYLDGDELSKDGLYYLYMFIKYLESYVTRLGLIHKFNLNAGIKGSYDFSHLNEDLTHKI